MPGPVDTGGHRYLVAGLGNPGSEYVRTRHNAGFLATDVLVKRWKLRWALEKKFKACVGKVDRQQGRRVWVCQPQTFMNASGEAVGALAAYHHIEPVNVLVIVDDADLPFGTLRLRPGGSSGGHHGLESIERHLGTRDFPRLKIGIGRNNPESREITGHVLGTFGATEMTPLARVLEQVCDQTECCVDFGVQQAMNQFNGVVRLE